MTYKLAANHLADLNQDELKLLRGRKPSSEATNALPFTYTFKDLADVPTSLNWTDKGAVNPVKDQAICGSCWSFGTVGTLEGTHFLNTGKLVKFSEQALVDCSWGFGNNGCDGGEEWRYDSLNLNYSLNCLTKQ